MIAANGRIGVGIVGASADRGWAKVAHVPAIALNPAFALVAVCASSDDSARAAGQAYGVDLTFGDHRALVVRPEVDLVVVAVKAPYHHAIMSAAIDAGKNVYCEWPLGTTLAESEDLAARARRRGVSAFVGLQARSSPAVRHLRRLQIEGRLGRWQGISMRGWVPAFGAVTDKANAYINDRASGASLLTISFSHSLDALCWSLGDVRIASSMLAIREPLVAVRDTGGTVERTSPDQVIATGLLPDGAPVSLHFQGGSTPRGNFDWDLAGSAGNFALSADTGNFQMSRAILTAGARDGAAMSPLAIPDDLCPVPSAPEGPAYNMAQVYARLARELAGERNEDRLPDFEDAVHRRRMIALIETMATTSNTDRDSGTPEQSTRIINI